MIKYSSDIIQLINLSMGEGIVAESPAIITSTGLGSCVALILYDKGKKVGGMAHVMLPDSKGVVHRPAEHPPMPPLEKRGGHGGVIFDPSVNSKFSPFWFADTAISYLLSDILKKGGSMKNILAKAAGGACMFPSYDEESKGIGEQNIENIKGLLTAMHLPLIGWDFGGNYGRSAEFYLETGRVLIKATGREDREI